MLDDSLRLQENPQLLALFSHYAQLGTEDRATWQYRLMQMEGVEPRQMSALHGELIAFQLLQLLLAGADLASARQEGTMASSNLPPSFCQGSASMPWAFRMTDGSTAAAISCCAVHACNCRTRVVGVGRRDSEKGGQIIAELKTAHAITVPLPGFRVAMGLGAWYHTA